MLYDLAIVGGGPGGAAAGVYAARKRLHTLFLTRDWGGQSVVSSEIQNWIGTPKMSGIELRDALKRHLESYAGDFLAIKDGVMVQKIEKRDDGFSLQTENGIFETKTILIATGSSRRKLAIAGADRLEHKGLTYCASCDGPVFADLDVAVIGGGNAAFETAAQLLAYCKSVTLLIRGTEFKADEITLRTVLAHPKMKTLINAELVEVKGEKSVSGLVYKNKLTGEKKELPVQGIFVEIGGIPNTGFAKGLVEENQYNQIITDPRNQRTSLAGIWAAGDCTDGLYHQNNIAAGDAVKALEDIYLFLHTK